MPCKDCSDPSRCTAVCEAYRRNQAPRRWSVLDEAMRLHDEAAEARRIFGKGLGKVPVVEANRSRQTREALRDFLAVHLVDQGGKTS